MTDPGNSAGQTRTITRAQLEEWGLPYEAAGIQTPEDKIEGRAIELHCEQIDTRRWYSVHRIVFVAPDDGLTWAVDYKEGLTELQEDTDPWNEKPEVEACRMESYEKTVTAWRKADGAA